MFFLNKKSLHKAEEHKHYLITKSTWLSFCTFSPFGLTSPGCPSSNGYVGTNIQGSYIHSTVTVTSEDVRKARMEKYLGKRKYLHTAKYKASEGKAVFFPLQLRNFSIPTPTSSWKCSYFSVWKPWHFHPLHSSGHACCCSWIFYHIAASLGLPNDYLEKLLSSV